jgi:photosystem II stability/assembly factor-like uncharacterized protein
MDGLLQPVPAGELPHDAGSDTPGLLVAPDVRMVYIWKWGVGLTRSLDGGATWSKVPLPSGHIAGVVMDPGRPGHLWLQMGSGGPTHFHLYRSDDGGDSWQEVPTRSMPMAAQQLPVRMASDPRFSGALWIGTDRGLFHTVDGGQTWDHAGGGLPPAMPMDGLAVSPVDQRRILAWREGTGVFSSDDGGKTWLRARSTFSYDYGCHATFDPLDGRHIYLACSSGLYVTRDGGRTWLKGVGITSAISVLASTGHPGLAYLVRPDQPGFFSRHGLVFRTTDGGATWQSWSGGDMLASDTIDGIAGFVP